MLAYPGEEEKDVLNTIDFAAELDLNMAENIKINLAASRQLSENEMTRQFLEDSIRTLGYKLRKACDSDDQRSIVKIYEILTKARRMLRDLQAAPAAS